MAKVVRRRLRQRWCDNIEDLRGHFEDNGGGKFALAETWRTLAPDLRQAYDKLCAKNRELNPRVRIDDMACGADLADLEASLACDINAGEVKAETAGDAMRLVLKHGERFLTTRLDIKDYERIHGFGEDPLPFDEDEYFDRYTSQDAEARAEHALERLADRHNARQRQLRR